MHNIVTAALPADSVVTLANWRTAPIATTGATTWTLDSAGANLSRLTKEELKRLLHNHAFVPMSRSDVNCLYCFALGYYRDRSDHDFVIHEQ